MMMTGGFGAVLDGPDEDCSGGDCLCKSRRRCTRKQVAGDWLS